MKIGDITKLLESLAQGLAGLSKDTANGLTKLRAGTQQFDEQTIDEFVEFLRKCDEYKRTGIVQTGKAKGTPKPKAGALSVPDAGGKVRALLADIDKGTVNTPRIDSLLDEIEKGLATPKKAEWERLLVELMISTKPKTIAHAKEMVRQVLNSQLEMYVKKQAHGGNG